MNRTSIVMLTWNRKEILINTIKSIKKFNPDVKNRDFIIVDNGSTDGTSEFLKTTNYNIVLNETNLGAQYGKYIGWDYSYKKGYDFILFIECDHPCIRKIPIFDLENYLDKNSEVGIVRLNDKKYYRIHHITKLPIVYYPEEKLNNKFKIFKTNYHFTSHPSIFRTSIVPFLKGCIYPKYKPKSIDVSQLGFENYKDKNPKRYQIAKHRCLYNWGKKEYEYMRLFFLRYQISAQINPSCFHYVVMKRSKYWKN